MKTYRHTAISDIHGSFRSDFTAPREYAVLYCGWKSLPEATKRRLADHEGLCYGWGRDLRHAETIAAEAAAAGCEHILIVPTQVHEVLS